MLLITFHKFSIINFIFFKSFIENLNGLKRKQKNRL